jgi:hypothetical protein
MRKFLSEKLHNPHVVLLFFLVIGSLVICLCRYWPVKPDGVYYDKDIAAVGGGYWIFKNGYVYIKTSESTNLITTYSKVGESWTYHSATASNQVVLQPTLFHWHPTSDKIGHNSFVFRRI